MALIPDVSYGDVFVSLIAGASVIYNYATFGARITNCEKDLDDIKRGRGLIMGPTSDWPRRVRWCFGMVSDDEKPKDGR